MRRRIRLFYVLVAAFVIVACGLITMNRLDAEITILENTSRETRLRLVDVEGKKSDMQKELAMKDSLAYIREKARALYDYVSPDEIRFVVVNPEVLYDADVIPEVEIVEESSQL